MSAMTGRSEVDVSAKPEQHRWDIPFPRTGCGLNCSSHYTRLTVTIQKMPWTHRGFWIGPLVIGAVLAALFLVVRNTRLRQIYNARLAESREERLFLAAVGFFTAVLTVRGLTIAIHNNIGPFHDVAMGGRHIHHLVWGILLLLTSGYGWLVEVGTGSEGSLQWVGRLMSMTYGVAAALTLDEFALWLNLKDVYWQREGRESFEAMALFGGLLAIGLFGRRFFRAIIFWRRPAN